MREWEEKANAEITAIRAEGDGPRLSVSVVLAALGEASAGTGAGLDHTVVELWRALGWEAKLVIATVFEAYLFADSGCIERPESWMDPTCHDRHTEGRAAYNAG